MLSAYIVFSTIQCLNVRGECITVYMCIEERVVDMVLRESECVEASELHQSSTKTRPSTRAERFNQRRQRPQPKEPSLYQRGLR